jgi:hypothetical protein
MSDFIDEKKDTVLRKVWTWYKNLKKWKKIILWICIIPLLLIWFWGDIKGKISNAGELSQAIFTEVKPKKELEKG